MNKFKHILKHGRYHSLSHHQRNFKLEIFEKVVDLLEAVLLDVSDRNYDDDGYHEALEQEVDGVGGVDVWAGFSRHLINIIVKLFCCN